MAKSKIVQVELDTVNFEELSFQAFLKDHKIDATVVEASGPGGGWPVIKYTGDYDDIVEMITFCWADRYLLKMITPV